MRILEDQRTFDTTSRMARPRSRPGPRGQLADRLRRTRERRGLSQVEAAREIGVARISLARWETGAHDPRGLSLRAIEAWIVKGGKRRGS